VYGGPFTEWEIAVHHGGGKWLMLGTSYGSDPQAALESWVEAGGDVLPACYGVSVPGQAEWQPFQVDAAGVHATDTHD